MQSKKGSFWEAVTNTFVGFIITLAFSPLIYSMCGIKYNYGQIGMATLLFTLLSIIRGYVIRRWFNKREKK